MNIVVVVVDRLHWGYLGCYGNTWVATPAFDRLAAEGFVFSQTLAESTDLAVAYDSLWRGSHALERTLQKATDRRSTLIELARGAGLRTILVTDEPIVAEHAAGAAFDDTAELDPPPEECPPAAEPGATYTARLFTEALERASADAGPFLLWLHARGFGGPWDAPPGFRNRYAEEDDPPPPEFTAVPRRELPENTDLDERFGIAQAYAGQVALVDLCLGGLLEHLEEAGLDHDTAVVLLSPRGIALGEHGAVGPFDERLHGELVQLPWIVRLPGGRGRLRRSQALVQPSDLYPTLAELLRERAGSVSDRSPHEAGPSSAAGPRSVLPLIDDPTAAWRDRAVVLAPAATSQPGAVGEIGIRTRSWYLRRRRAAPDAEGPADELFAKPDDAWEATDVADRCSGIVELLRQAEADLRQAIVAGTAPAPLEEALLTGWD